MREGVAFLGWSLGAFGVLMIFGSAIDNFHLTPFGRLMLRMGGASTMIVAMILI